jgi:hypothetical protein
MTMVQLADIKDQQRPTQVRLMTKGEQSLLSLGVQRRPRIHLGVTLINQIPHRQKGPK